LIKLKRGTILDSKNIAADILKLENGGKELEEIGALVVKEYKEDKLSRKGWEKQMSNANKLALQVVEEKTFPWPGASNVKFPLITIAALQFSSRISPAFLSVHNLVKCGILGKDPSGEKRDRAERIQTHMNYQLRREDDNWEEDHDRMLFALPIVGTTFKKTYYDPIKGHNVSEYILPDHLVMDYKGKFDSTERKTHRLFFTPRQVKEKKLSEFYLDVDLMEPAYTPDQEQAEKDHREGTQPTNVVKLHELLEQHTVIDLDGDGYQEPYIVTVNLQDQKVVRIAPAYSEGDIKTKEDAQIKAIFRQAQRSTEQGQNPDQNIEIMNQAEEAAINIKREADVTSIATEEYFTQYTLIPNPDSGIYALGFGTLLGPITESINTALNQIFDAGSLATAGGGWFGKGLKVRGGKVRVIPGTWQQIQVAGSDLKNNIVPYPIKEPSGVLFNLLNLLINYGERVASVTDTMVGELPGQNTPATTSKIAQNEGMKVFQGIFKRIFRATTKEFRKLYLLNRKYVDMEQYTTLLDDEVVKLEGDYLGDIKDIEPAADESAITDEQKMMKAQFLDQQAQSKPGFDQTQVQLRLLRAMGIEEVNEVFPTQQNQETGQLQPVIPPPQNPELEIDKAEAERKAAESNAKAQVEQGRLELDSSKTQADNAVKRADIMLKMAQVKKLDVEADLAPFLAELEALRVKNEAIAARYKSSGNGETN
jgi:chaperonin GroES